MQFNGHVWNNHHEDHPDLFAVMLTLGVLSCAQAGVQPAALLCEYHTDQLGIDAARPRLSWVVQSDQRGQRQTAYRVLVASSPGLLAEDRGDLWDSGPVASGQFIHVEYAGRPPQSAARYYWKVRLWDKDVQVSSCPRGLRCSPRQRGDSVWARFQVSSWRKTALEHTCYNSLHNDGLKQCYHGGWWVRPWKAKGRKCPLWNFFHPASVPYRRGIPGVADGET